MQEAHKLTDAIAASEEHMEELKARISARQEWIDKEQASVDAKIEEATRPVAAERAEAAQAHITLLDEVEELRYTQHPSVHRAACDLVLTSDISVSVHLC